VTRRLSYGIYLTAPISSYVPLILGRISQLHKDGGKRYADISVPKSRRYSKAEALTMAGSDATTSLLASATYQLAWHLIAMEKAVEEVPTEQPGCPTYLL
jgi:hypothetical protein